MKTVVVTVLSAVAAAALARRSELPAAAVVLARLVRGPSMRKGMGSFELLITKPVNERTRGQGRDLIAASHAVEASGDEVRVTRNVLLEARADPRIVEPVEEIRLREGPPGHKWYTTTIFKLALTARIISTQFKALLCQRSCFWRVFFLKKMGTCKPANPPTSSRCPTIMMQSNRIITLSSLESILIFLFHY